MAENRVNGIALASIGVGAVFAWSGLKNRKITETIQDIIRGRKPAPGPESNIVQSNQAVINQATGNTGAQGYTATHNQSIAKKLAIPFGWSGGQQWTCLVELWNQESGWSNTAENASGAYGIPQALPNTKMPLSARPPSEGGSANPYTQIAWGLTYILTRYGSPCNAWTHETSYGWY